MRIALMIVLMQLALGVWAQESPQPNAVHTPNIYSESAIYVPGIETEKPNKTKDPKPARETTPSSKTLAIPVTVLDKSGTFIRGLFKDDFEVYVDGERRDVVDFRGDDEPVDMIVLIDTSPSAEFKMANIQNFIISTLNKSRPEDRMSLIRFDGKIKVLQELTSDRPAILKAIKKLDFGEGTRLYDAIGKVAKEYSATPDRTGNVVLFTDGVDTTSSQMDHASSLLAAQQSSLTFFPIYVDSFPEAVRNLNSIKLPTGPNRIRLDKGARIAAMKIDYDNGKVYLQDLLTLTGGRAFKFSTNDLAHDLADQVRRKYSLVIDLSGLGPSSHMRQIRVRVNRPDLTILPKQTLASNH